MEVDSHNPYDMSFTLNSLIPYRTDCYDMSSTLSALNMAGMKTLCVDSFIKLIANWVHDTDHTFPKTRKAWTNLINTQFHTYCVLPNSLEANLFDSTCRAYKWVLHQGNLYIRANPELIINEMVRYEMLVYSKYERKLRINIFRCKYHYQ